MYCPHLGISFPGALSKCYLEIVGMLLMWEHLHKSNLCTSPLRKNCDLKNLITLSCLGWTGHKREDKATSATYKWELPQQSRRTFTRIFPLKKQCLRKVATCLSQQFVVFGYSTFHFRLHWVIKLIIWRKTGKTFWPVVQVRETVLNWRVRTQKWDHFQ